MPRKRKKLVENFEELLEAGDMDALKAVYDACALNAVFGYSKDTCLLYTSDAADDCCRV